MFWLDSLSKSLLNDNDHLINESSVNFGFAIQTVLIFSLMQVFTIASTFLLDSI